MSAAAGQLPAPALPALWQGPLFVLGLMLSAAVAQRLVNNISTAADNAVNTDAQPVLLVTPLIRPHLAQIVTRFLPTVPVISQAEIPPDIRLQSVGVVSAE